MINPLNVSHDKEVDAWYFSADEIDPGVSVSQEEIGTYTVILDRDANGNVVGVELI